MRNDEMTDAAKLAASFQCRVGRWALACFTPEIVADKIERADRFIEEALELAQATGYSAERAHALVDYTFGRPPGEPFQEVGGVRVTLSALCNAHEIQEDAAAEAELSRISAPDVIEKIRAKQAAKPTGSALLIALRRTTEQRADTAALADELERRWETGVFYGINRILETRLAEDERRAILTALRTPTPADHAEKAEALLREAREASEQARDILETYIGFLHHIPAADLEMHPYIPSVEGAFDLASSAVTRIDAHLAGEPGDEA